METWTNLPCAATMICIEVVRGGGGVCIRFCTNNAHCRGHEYCEVPVFVGIDDIGVCLEGTCVDNDADGFCETNDCNDSDPNTNPGAVDHCEDGIDQNCDGVDEVCTGCTDADGDGHCVETDCDDANAGVHPGAGENCDDGVDNDCNGLTDGAEESCGGGGGGGGGGTASGCYVVSPRSASPLSFLPFIAALLGLGWMAYRKRS